MSIITNEVGNDKQEKTYYPLPSEFKAEALKLAERGGVAAAARQLSLHEFQNYGWRKAAKSDTNPSQRKKDLAAEELDIVIKPKVDCYEFMLEYLLNFSVARMAKVFGVLRSGFHY